jgi:hypothetical protein
MLTTTIRTIVHAQWETVWELLLDRIENPQRYQPLVLTSKVIEKSADWVIREIKVQNMVIRERISLDKEKTIHSELLEHPQYEGTIVTRLVPTSTQNPMAPVYLETNFKLEHKSVPMGGAVITDKEMTSALNDEMELIKKKAEELEK